MRIPDNAVVRRYVDVEKRHLVVGRIADENYLAIRAEVHGDESAKPYLVTLGPAVSNGRAAPYLAHPSDSTNVLDLGDQWSIDVPIDASTPFVERASRQDSKAILARSGTEWFLDLRQESPLDLQTGLLLSEFPDRPGVASWNRFIILLHPDGLSGPGEFLFRWPPKRRRPRKRRM